MKLIRYEHPDLSLANTVDRFFSPMFRGLGAFGDRYATLQNGTVNGLPSVDIHEGDQAYRATLALPGWKKDEIKLELNNNVLTVTAERHQAEGGHESHSKMSRSLSVPDGVDTAQVSARMQDGLLYLTMPKSEGSQPLTIDIQ